MRVEAVHESVNTPARARTPPKNESVHHRDSVRSFSGGCRLILRGPPVIIIPSNYQTSEFVLIQDDCLQTHLSLIIQISYEVAPGK